MNLETLHANRETLLAYWSDRVNDARANGHDDPATYFATGPILLRNNELVMYVIVNGERSYDIGITPAGEIYVTL